MNKKIVLLFAISLSLLACGRNPQLEKKVKPNVDPILNSPLEPLNAAPQLILKEKGSSKEDIVDFGLMKTGERSTKTFELQNIGGAKALDLKIPAVVGNFKITNVNCEKELDVKESCDLTGEIISQDEKLENGELVVNFKDPAGNKLKSKLILIANVRAPVLTKTPEARLVLFVKSGDSGPVVLKDIPVGEAIQLQLELRNVGDAEAKDVVIPTIPAPFQLKSHDCPATLAVDAACNIIVEYKPVQAKEENIQVRIEFRGGYLVHVIIANSIALASDAKLDVVDGVISQDIYELMNIHPEQLSPFQEVRGIDLGELTQNVDKVFNITLDNIGGSAAKVTKVKDFTSNIFKFNETGYPGKTGTCSTDIAKGRCNLNVKVSPKDLGNIHDIVEITYLDVRGNTRRLSLILMANVKAAPTVTPPVVIPSPACKILVARSSDQQSQVIGSLSAVGAYKLPYKQSAAKATAKLSLGFNTDSNLNLRMTKNHDTLVVPTNHNVMVQFGFDVSKAELARFRHVKLELDILKISTEGVKFDTTEVLCLNETKRCSGTFFIDSNYSKLNTSNYLMYSNFFSSELNRSSQQNISGLREALAQRGTLLAQGTAKSTDNMFRLKKGYPLASLFGQVHNSDYSRGMNFILADDSVLLAAPRLILEEGPGACSGR